MASAFKRKHRNPAGRLVEAETFTVAFVDDSDTTRPRGIQRQVAGYASEAASEELGRALDKLVGLRRGREPVPADLQRFFDGLPVKVRAKLGRWGLLSVAAEAAKRGLDEHVRAYEEALRLGVASAKQRGRPATAVHVQKTGNRVRELIRRTGAKSFADFTPGAVAKALRELQAKGRRSKGIGSKTAAHYFGAVFAFLEWSRREKLIVANPLADAAKPDANAEKRHARRALEPDEVCRALAAAADGPERYGMPGASRALLWRLLAETGLRAGEARKLVRADLALGERPSVTVRAENAKSGRARTIPLQRGLADAFRAVAAGKLPTVRVFKLPKPEDLVKAWRADLADGQVAWVKEAATDAERGRRAGADFLRYEDAAGRFADVHSLRVTFATNLIAAGVDVKTAQALLGHASATMTLDVYAKVFRGSDEAAIARLPSYHTPQRDRLRKTGSLDTPGHCTTDCTTAGSFSGSSERGGSTLGPRGACAENATKTGQNCTAAHEKSPAGAGLGSTPPRGFEPLSPA
jgi:integrase